LVNDVLQLLNTLTRIKKKIINKIKLLNKE